MLEINSVFSLGFVFVLFLYWRLWLRVWKVGYLSNLCPYGHLEREEAA